MVCVISVGTDVTIVENRKKRILVANRFFFNRKFMIKCAFGIKRWSLLIEIFILDDFKIVWII